MFDTLKDLEEYIEERGYTVSLTDVDVDNQIHTIELPIVGSNQLVHMPGRRELYLNIRAKLFISPSCDTSPDELEEAINRFDASVRPLKED